MGEGVELEVDQVLAHGQTRGQHGLAADGVANYYNVLWPRVPAHEVLAVGAVAAPTAPLLPAALGLAALALARTR